MSYSNVTTLIPSKNQVQDHRNLGVWGQATCAGVCVWWPPTCLVSVPLGSSVVLTGGSCSLIMTEDGLWNQTVLG